MTQPALSPRDQIVLKALCRRSDRRGLVRAGGHMALIVATGALVWAASANWWTLLPAMAVHGTAVVFLFCALHESAHRTAFASPALNAGMAWLAGLAVLLPPTWFRAYHLAHHRHTRIPGEDPELDGRQIETTRDWLVHVSGLPYWRSALSNLVRQALGQAGARYLPEHLKPRIVREARVFLGVYSALAAMSVLAGSGAVLVYWLLPVLLGQPVLRLYLLAEHAMCPHVSDPFANTRTTFTTRFVRFIAWNMPYHTEHHAFMAVPFHRLPDLHDMLAGRLAVTENGYARFNARYLREVSGG